MKPGVTCVLPGPGSGAALRRVLTDLEYIDNWSLGLDLKILLRTIPVVLTGRGAY